MFCIEFQTYPLLAPLCRQGHPPLSLDEIFQGHQLQGYKTSAQQSLWKRLQGNMKVPAEKQHELLQHQHDLPQLLLHQTYI